MLQEVLSSVAEIGAHINLHIESPLADIPFIALEQIYIGVEADVVPEAMFALESELGVHVVPHDILHVVMWYGEIAIIDFIRVGGDEGESFYPFS